MVLYTDIQVSTIWSTCCCSDGTINITKNEININRMKQAMMSLNSIKFTHIILNVQL